MIELKAREDVAREAPLGPLVATHRNYNELIRRGLKTVYHVADDLNDNDASFGLRPMPGFDYFEFQIVGLPPPTGTVVWVMGMIDKMEIDAAVYLSLDDLKADIEKTMSGRFVTPATLLYNQTVADPISGLQTLIDMKEDAGFYLRQITLP